MGRCVAGSYHVQNSLYCPLLLQPAVRNESHMCCPWGMAEEGGSVCSPGTADGSGSLLLLEDRAVAARNHSHCAVSGASQKHTIMHVMSLQNHICEAWRMFLFPNVNYWVILFMWDRLNSLPKELLWITITTRQQMLLSRKVFHTSSYNHGDYFNLTL